MKTITQWRRCAALASSIMMLSACNGAVVTSGESAEDSGGDADGSASIPGSGSNSVEDCKAYLDESPLGTLTITITNHRAASIFMSDDANCSSAFSVGAPLSTPMIAEPRGYDFTCADGHEYGHFTGDCMNFGETPIAPGETATLTWKGLLYEQITMPQSCFSPSSFDWPSCLQGKAPPAGVLEVTVYLAGATQCTNSGCTGELEHFSVTQSFSYPSDEQIQIDVNP
jgi:hypothetical protein